MPTIDEQISTKIVAEVRKQVPDAVRVGVRDLLERQRRCAPYSDYRYEPGGLTEDEVRDTLHHVREFLLHPSRFGPRPEVVIAVPVRGYAYDSSYRYGPPMRSVRVSLDR